MKIGADIGILMLTQCLAGVIGLRTIIQLQCKSLDCGDAAIPAGWPATWATVAFLLPLTPLIFYLMTFWKDSWLAISFLWGGAYLIWLFHNAGSLTTRHLNLHIFGASILWALTYSVRHNALAVLPVVGLCLWAIARKRHNGWRAWWAILLPIFLALLAAETLKICFRVEDSQIIAVQKASDLTGACVLDVLKCPAFPFTSSHLEPWYREHYTFGDAWPLLWAEKRIVKNGYFNLDGENPQLDREYMQLLLNHPLLWARVKAMGFSALVGTEGAPKSWYWSRLENNSFGLRLNDKYGGVRRILFGVAWRVWHNPVLRWVSGIHLIWLAAGLGLLGIEVYRIVFQREDKHLFSALLLCIPLSYYFSYCLAAPATDFRMMYPATLLMQTLTLSFTATMARWVFWRKSSDSK